MFYKKQIYTIEEGSITVWHTGTRISLPDGNLLSDTNRDNDFGWEWHDEPPNEYLEWLEKQQEL